MQSTLSDKVTHDFVEYCGGRGLDPEETLAFLGRQDWKGAKDDEANAEHCTGQLSEYTDDMDEGDGFEMAIGHIPEHTDDTDDSE
jgi:hypothetical protein